MANALFSSYRAAALTADCDLDDSIQLVFVDHADDIPSPASDNFLDDILVAARVKDSGPFSGKTFTDGVFDANDVVVSAVSGDPFESIVIYDATPGSDATRDLIAFIDSATGMPTTPNGGDITVQWDSGTNRIFKI